MGVFYTNADDTRDRDLALIDKYIGDNGLMVAFVRAAYEAVWAPGYAENSGALSVDDKTAISNGIADEWDAVRARFSDVIAKIGSVTSATEMAKYVQEQFGRVLGSTPLIAMHGLDNWRALTSAASNEANQIYIDAGVHWRTVGITAVVAGAAGYGLKKFVFKRR